MKIADIHAHIFPDKLAEKASHSIGDFYGVSIEREANMHCLTAEDRLAGVTRCVVSNSATSAKQVFNANTFLAEAVRGHEGYLAFGTIYPGMDGYEEELDRMLELGLRGIKLHSDFQGFAIDDKKMLPVYKACMVRDLPILFHMGDARSELSAPKKLANVLEKLPELKCIAAHLGGYQRWDEAKACLKGANVWVDTSSSLFVLNPDEARRSIEHFGMDKVMFGTDFPMWTHEKELERFFALGYGEEENRKMLYDNFEKLFKL